MISPIKKTEENNEYAEDFDHLSGIELEKDLFSQDKRKTESLLLKDLVFDSKSIENHKKSFEKSIEKPLEKNLEKHKEKIQRKKRISLKKDDNFSKESCSIFRISMKFFY